MVLFDLKKLGKIEEAEFVERKNRFVGLCQINNQIRTCHIADSGRLKEILTEGRKLLVVKNSEKLKTDYRVLAARMEDGWVLLNTSFHSKIGKKAIENGVLGFKPEKIKTEVQFRKSRIDYLINDKIFVELKGSNLLSGKKCLFPDAPTERGKRHLEELMQAVKQGYRAVILIMVLRKCRCFETNRKLDPRFSETFEKALQEGVQFVGFRVKIDENLNVVLKEKINLCR
ncbi:sugar fermentation stimulation protein A [Persephonella hydrogeniphila]|uniref:Sugar fermentation stimulation protein homolog n=1 Tax=Persephonella hydrogeniphila TaxID=198703 RepID=A0A285N1G9_9AQUI|nr:DNA/RNA nuclease SfsA [Persephonella hydrogeniphila]SNZ03314.1 sugar fermentation stimulation protein A [Persephonella hydrogeniphila]